MSTAATSHAEALARATLDDRYTQTTGRVFMSGTQALVRLPMLQQMRDRASGLATAGFISGYRGSPLGGYDQALWGARAHLAAHDIVFQPGVNEELAATAIWGTQQLDLNPQHKRYDGVFGIWYGKGPGVDRCADVFKHANLAGTARYGGVIAVAGDDHVAKSSTAAHQSDHIFKACGMPLFFPASAQEILDLGLHAFALSRYAGVWSAMKTIQEVVESAAAVDVDSSRVQIVLPDDFAMPADGVHIRWPDAALEQEARLFDHKWYAALAYVRANRLNRTVIGTSSDRFGILASGKAYNDTCQALADLGLDVATCQRLGIRLHKVGVVWPLEATGSRAFAQGLQEILVVEEKRPFMEYQLKEELYNWRPDVRPRVLGKFDAGDHDDAGGEWSRPNPSDNWLLRAKADLTPAIIAVAIAGRLQRLGVPDDVAARMQSRIDVITSRARSLAPIAHLGSELSPLGVETTLPAVAADTAPPTTPLERKPWFCAGCPHNTSTRVPEGSRALAGIGCHYMALWMDRSTTTFSQMGGEGVAWVGQAPFTTEKHVFANLGDGTYFHSGVLAIRQSIAADVNITYKLLFNDAVAMTGGQPVDGKLDVAAITRELAAEGVRRIVVVSDEPEKYAGHKAELAPGVDVRHRDELDAIQREFRELRGCTVIVYDQTCATEKRRRRKRGKLATPARTVLINEEVCEGCGDCSAKSNCLAVEPVETALGTKRRVNQSACNKDYSCLNGFCPSFVTIEGGAPRSALPAMRPQPPPIPEPQLPDTTRAYGIIVAGIGGTGVITIGQLLGMAAHLDGRGVVTQDAAGLAQKGGATWSHVQIANTPAAIFTTKVGTAKAMLVLGCDPIVTADPATLSLMHETRTFVALNVHGTPTSAFLRDANWHFPSARCEAAIERAAGSRNVARVDAEQIAVAAVGDAIYANLVLLGYAWQRGRVPVGHAALMRAIELNGTQIENNKLAFAWGRACAHDAAAVAALLDGDDARPVRVLATPSDDQLINDRVQRLTDYQNTAYASAYKALVARVRDAESRLGVDTHLSATVARCLFRLMAYKDEYEVARLHTSAAFNDPIAAAFSGDYRVVHHLAPPGLTRRTASGEPAKHAFGPWLRRVLPLLARLKVLRGSAFDPFGYNAERRTERALIAEYRADIETLLAHLDTNNLPLALRIAAVPEGIRGFGHVKQRHITAAREQRAELLRQWQQTFA